jgi:hypothetical protein
VTISSEEFNRAIKAIARSADNLARMQEFIDAHQFAMSRAFEVAQKADVAKAIDTLVNGQMAAIDRALQGFYSSADWMLAFEKQTRFFDSIRRAPADAVANLGSWAVSNAEIRAAAAAVAAGALMGDIEETFTIGALDAAIEQTDDVDVSPPETPPGVSTAEAIRYAVWMVLAPALIIYWNHPDIGPWLKDHLELLAFLVVMTKWGLKALLPPES